MATRPPPRQPLPRLAAAALLVLAGCTSYPAPPTQPNPPAPDGGSPPGTVEKPHVRILFIGNSLTSTNDLPAAVQALASAHVQGWAGVSVEAVAPGGKLLSGHLLDLQDAGTSLHALLGSSARW
ncbi:MAG: hypothetical protein FJ086_04705, partial [Deltaproteobacteria bacterium]|nr:hypothetical protein [Deltaproteobacteria bacterium]